MPQYGQPRPALPGNPMNIKGGPIGPQLPSKTSIGNLPGLTWADPGAQKGLQNTYINNQPFKPASVIGNGGGGGQVLGSAAPSPSGAMQTAQQFNQTQNFGPTPEEIAAIDAEFNTALTAADTSEGFLRQQAGVQTSQAEAGYEPAKTQIQQEGDIRTQDLDTQAGNEQKRSQSAMEQVRQLFSELSQANTSGLAARGISSSSVADALSERLGRETAQRVAGITDDTNTVLKNIDTEKGRVVQFTQAKLSDLERNLANAKANIQLALQEGLNQVVNARNMANSQRAALRADIARQAQAQAQAAQQQATQFAQQLYLWQVQRQAALDDAKKFTVNKPQGPNFSEFFTTPEGALLGFDKSSQSVSPIPGAPASGLFKLGSQAKSNSDDDLLRQLGLGVPTQ